MDLKKSSNPRQGEIWLFDPDPVKGTEVGKKIRPALVMSCNLLNRGSSGLVIIVPITSREKHIPSHIKIEPRESGLTKTSFILCEQIRAISKERLIKKAGQIRNVPTLHKVSEWISDLLRLEII